MSQTVTVPVAGTAEADVENEYDLKLGSLLVTKIDLGWGSGGTAGSDRDARGVQ